MTCTTRTTGRQKIGALCWTDHGTQATLRRPNVKRMIASAASLALMMVVVTGCAAWPAAPPRQVVPHTQLSLEDVEIVSGDDVDLHTAVQTREAVESEFMKAYGQKGHPRWFFHAFDGTNLDFVVARFEPARKGTGSRYVALRRLRVKRSPDAERALGVLDVVHDYDSRPRPMKAPLRPSKQH